MASADPEMLAADCVINPAVLTSSKEHNDVPKTTGGRPSRFLLHHEKPPLFLYSQWRLHPIIYCVYRVITAFYLTTWVVLSGLDTFTYAHKPRDRWKWFVYLTHWSFTVLCACAMLRAGLACYATFRRRRGNEVFPEMSVVLRVTWLLHNVSTCLALVVTSSYWSLDYDGGPVHWVNLHLHAFNSLYVLLDTLISAVPVRAHHFYQPMIYGACYITFSYTYYLLGGEDYDGNPYIYRALNWRDPWASLVVGAGGTLVGVTCFWVVLYGLYRLRLVLSRKLHPNHTPGENVAPSVEQLSGMSNQTFGISSVENFPI